MGQVSWRAPEELIDRVRHSASVEHTSVNAYITRVLDAVTNPTSAPNKHERLRERLMQAGLLASPSSAKQQRRPSREEVQKARRAAGKGTPLSELVAQDRV